MYRISSFILIASSFLLAYGFAVLTPCAANAQNNAQPNIILINLDDADTDLMSPDHIGQRFPNFDKLVKDGIYFSNLHVTTPLCGPSRACLLRGQYAHRTGIRVNLPTHISSAGFSGGMQLYKENGFLQDDLSVWMKNAGYRTMIVGRYLNGDFVFEVPPGWDDYYASLGGSYYETSRFTNRNFVNGDFERLQPGEYRTTAEAADAVNLIQQHVDADPQKPFFLYVAPLAPHSPASNAVGGAATERYARWWTKAVVPFSVDLDEPDISDKTSVLNMLLPMSPHRIEYADSLFRDRLRSTRSVDDMFQTIIETLEANEILDDTYIFVTSDNGFQLGHHRLIGKGTPFDRSTRVPLYVLGPNVPQATSANHLLAHIDITATLLELAGVPVPEFVNGKSFVPILTDPSSVPEHQWREPVLIENWQSKIIDGKRVQLASTGLRFYDSVYTEWADGSTEYYDLANDPFQLENTYEQLPALEKLAMGVLVRQAKNEMDPETVIALPFEKNQLIDSDFVVTGFAEDDSEIDNVQITIRDAVTKRYWDGTNWVDNHARYAANLVNQGHQITKWTTNLPQADAGIHRLIIWARAYDGEGNYDLSTAKTWVRARTLPVGEITLPLQHEVVDGQDVQIRGDFQNEIDDIWLVVLRLNERLYWNGTEWTADWSFVQPTILSDHWEYGLDLEDGDYFVSSRLRKNGVMQSPPATRRFQVVND